MSHIGTSLRSRRKIRSLLEQQRTLVGIGAELVGRERPETDIVKRYGNDVPAEV
jgi:hypothetical protein